MASRPQHGGPKRKGGLKIADQFFLGHGQKTKFLHAPP
jgi:hypothetical protein